MASVAGQTLTPTLAAAQVTGIFGSSMEVMVSVCGETPAEGSSVFHCGDAYATVVAVDPEGQPAEVPFELVPGSPDDARRCAGVAARCVDMDHSTQPSLIR